MEVDKEPLTEEQIAMTVKATQEIDRKFSKLKGRKLEPKYRDPETGKTWAGRGKYPRWMAGKDKEAFRI